MNILFVAHGSGVFKQNGGSAVSMRNLHALKAVGDVTFCSMIENERTLIQKIIDLLLTPVGVAMRFRNYKKIKKLIKQNKFDYVFFDSSIVGSLVKLVKKRKQRAIVFFHNVEKKYYNEAVRKKGFIKLVMAKNIEKNERLSVKYADKILMLNERDKSDLEKHYGKVDEDKIRLLPVTFKDNLTEEEVAEQKLRECSKPMTGLFLGSNFLPNYEGMKWFVENVADKINCNIEICGVGFGKCSDEFSRRNVRVAADLITNTKPYYLNADFVIAPIFIGSGMKVKTCEALMYGKTIFGTTETFEGYDVDFDKVGGLCNTAEEYIEAINKFVDNPNSKKFNEYSRQVYLDNYSDEYAQKVIEKTIEV